MNIHYYTDRVFTIFRNSQHIDIPRQLRNVIADMEADLLAEINTKRTIAANPPLTARPCAIHLPHPPHDWNISGSYYVCDGK